MFQTTYVLVLIRVWTNSRIDYNELVWIIPYDPSLTTKMCRRTLLSTKGLYCVILVQ